MAFAFCRVSRTTAAASLKSSPSLIPNDLGVRLQLSSLGPLGQGKSLLPSRGSNPTGCPDPWVTFGSYENSQHLYISGRLRLGAEPNAFSSGRSRPLQQFAREVRPKPRKSRTAWQSRSTRQGWA